MRVSAPIWGEPSLFQEFWFFNEFNINKKSIRYETAKINSRCGGCRATSPRIIEQILARVVWAFFCKKERNNGRNWTIIFDGRTGGVQRDRVGGGHAGALAWAGGEWAYGGVGGNWAVCGRVPHSWVFADHARLLCCLCGAPNRHQLPIVEKQITLSLIIE